MTSSCSKTIYESMILPLLTYCGTLQLNITNTHKLRLDSLHHRALTVISCDAEMKKPIIAPYIRNKIHSLMLVKQCLDNSVCSNFKDYFQIASHTKSTRNSGFLLKLPKLRLEYMRSSFCYMGAKFFNDLPCSIRKIEDIKLFRQALQDHALCWGITILA